MGKRELNRVRKMVLALPEVSERQSDGAPCFFIRNKKPLCRYHDNHRGDSRVSLWCPVPVELQEALVGADPERFFKPQASSSGTFSNWIGVLLDTPNVNWDEVAAILEEAYLNVAPKALISELGDV